MATQRKCVKGLAKRVRAAVEDKKGDSHIQFAYTGVMSRLDSAMARFAAALDKLDQALARRPAAARLDDALAKELRGLKEDRTRLASELERLNGEKVALEGFTDEVAGRLEGAIREIRAVLSH
jgi:hypothetical protein